MNSEQRAKKTFQINKIVWDLKPDSQPLKKSRSVNTTNLSTQVEPKHDFKQSKRIMPRLSEKTGLHIKGLSKQPPPRLDTNQGLNVDHLTTPNSISSAGII